MQKVRLGARRGQLAQECGLEPLRAHAQRVEDELAPMRERPPGRAGRLLPGDLPVGAGQLPDHRIAKWLARTPAAVSAGQLKILAHRCVERMNEATEHGRCYGIRRIQPPIQLVGLDLSEKPAGRNSVDPGALIGLRVVFTFKLIEVMNRKAIDRIGPRRLPEPDLAEPFGQDGAEDFLDNLHDVRRSIGGPISEPVEASREIAQVLQHGRAFGPGERLCCPIGLESPAHAVDRAPESLRLAGRQLENGRDLVALVLGRSTVREIYLGACCGAAAT